MYSLFDYAFAPTRIVVVSEERLKQAERDATEQRMAAIDQRIEELSKYRNSLYEEIKALLTDQINDEISDYAHTRTD